MATATRDAAKWAQRKIKTVKFSRFQERGQSDLLFPTQHLLHSQPFWAIEQILDTLNFFYACLPGWMVAHWV